MFLSQCFFPTWILIVLIHKIWEQEEQVKKSILLPKNVLTFPCLNKFMQILGFQPQIFKTFSRSLEQFFLTVGQNNFGNKIPLPTLFPNCRLDGYFCPGCLFNICWKGNYWILHWYNFPITSGLLSGSHSSGS